MRIPKVSIVIPCYKGEVYLERAIESCLEQEYEDLEVVIVDDCSPDNSATIAQKFVEKDSRVSLVRRARNGGVARAWNTGFNSACGSYFLRLAQDDWFKPAAVSSMVEYLDQHSDVGLTYAPMDIVKDDGTVLVTYETPAENPLLPSNKLGLCVMWRRQVWDAVGAFDPKCDFAEDYDYWLRVSRVFKIARSSDVSLLNFRHHASQNSVSGETRQLRGTRRALWKQRGRDVIEHPLSFRVWYRFARSSAAYGKAIVCL